MAVEYRFNPETAQQELIRELRKLEREGDLEASRKLAAILGHSICCVCGKRLPPYMDMCFGCEMGGGDDVQF